MIKRLWASAALSMLLATAQNFAAHAADTTEDVVASQSIASTAARMDAMEEQMRKIRGDSERTQHLLLQLNKKLDGMSKDIDFRLGELEHAGAGAASAVAADGAVSLDVPPLPASDKGAVTLDVPPLPDLTKQALKIEAPKTIIKESNAPKMEIKITEPKPKAAVSPEEPVIDDAAPQPAVVTPLSTVPTVKVPIYNQPLPNDDGAAFTVPSFASAREHYNYAFGLMNKAQYQEAGDVFSSFLERYPDDPLRGNVYYWLGETHYVRENYKKAIDNFRQGFEESPQGNKAPDNLLKLAMSLEKDNKESESCLVLEKLVEKYPSPEAIAKKAAEQIEKLSCRESGQ